MTNAFVLDSPAADSPDTRSKRTPFASASPSEPRLLRGRPLGNQLLVRKVKFQDRGHIITPETAHWDTGETDVIAIGSKVEEIQPGDRVMTCKSIAASAQNSNTTAICFW